MSDHYIRSYVPGSITNDGWTVVCVPGMRAAEVIEPLATKLTDLVLARKYEEARILMGWFGGQRDGQGDSDAEAR